MFTWAGTILILDSPMQVLYTPGAAEQWKVQSPATLLALCATSLRNCILAIEARDYLSVKSLVSTKFTPSGLTRESELFPALK